MQVDSAFHHGATRALGPGLREAKGGNLAADEGATSLAAAQPTGKAIGEQ